MMITNVEIKELMNDAHNNFFKKYRDINLNNDPKLWDEIVSDFDMLMNKYKKFTNTRCTITGEKTEYTATPILMWFLDILEMRAKENEKSREKKN